MAQIDFLRTEISVSDLEAALRVMRAFKELETTEEWLLRPFLAWSMFEMLEEHLAFLVEGKELEEDTVRVARRAGIEPMQRKQQKPEEKGTDPE